ncbi:MAG: hypothetical protein NT051_00370 [Candidatus Micrarchaeota archaeon]|nr:hypothetical protein [Candidatus Micrarchaeota archaeon]
MPMQNLQSLKTTIYALDRDFRAACKVIFGQEIGGMEEYAEWLSYGNEPMTHTKSQISDKEMLCSPPYYSPGGKWAAFEEVDFNRRFAPLSINDMKDIDSIARAAQERFLYAGNIYFGNSGFIELSSNINDSFYVYRACGNGNSKYLAYSTIGRRDLSVYGCNGVEESSHCIKCTRAFKSSRCFELWMSQNCTECYYSSGLTGCSNCFFCFNVKNKKNAIGNIELPPERYKAIKEKLLAEITENLRKNKFAPTLLQISQKCKPHRLVLPASTHAPEDATNKETVEKAFLRTTHLLFGKPLEGGIDKYAKWLSRRTKIPQGRKSAADGSTLYISPYANYQNLPADRLISSAQAAAHGAQAKMSAQEAESITLANAHEKIGAFAYFNIEMMEGKNLNLCKCQIASDSSNCYRASFLRASKSCGYCFWMDGCADSFGCYGPFDTFSAIHTHYCNAQSRTFEIDCCGHCYDSYFLHNCENVRESMFCFGVKNRKNCIGNAELGVATYAKVKNALCEQMWGELGKKKDLTWDIYNIGAGKP